MSEGNEVVLNEREQVRLDETLSAARSMHYFSFLAAGLGLALSSAGASSSGLKLPLGDVALPILQAEIGLYVVAVCLASVVLILVDAATPWMRLDPRRTSFPWFALGHGMNPFVVFLWVFLPVAICAAATAISVREASGSVLSMAGLFLVLMPRFIQRYATMISLRVDERRKPITLSVWLLYWIRLISGMAFTFAFFLSMLAIVPTWRSSLAPVAGGAFATAIGLRLIRLVGAFVHPSIDRFGVRRGYAAEMTPKDT